MKKIAMLLLASMLTGCVMLNGVPTYVPIHDDFITLVEADVDIGGQTLFKGQKLDHYNIDGADAYCSRLVSSNLNLYRCFLVDGDQLTTGLHPMTSEWRPLSRNVPIIKQTN